MASFKPVNAFLFLTIYFSTLVVLYETFFLKWFGDYDMNLSSVCVSNMKYSTVTTWDCDSQSGYTHGALHSASIWVTFLLPTTMSSGSSCSHSVKGVNFDNTCSSGMPSRASWFHKLAPKNYINWKFQQKNGFYCHQIMSHLSKAKIAPVVYGLCAYWTKPGTKFHPAQRFFPGIDLIEREKSRLKSISGRRYSLLSISNITRKGGVKLEKPET